MSLFDPVIGVSQYENGLFPKVPTIMPKRAILLRCSANGTIICVDNRTTPREISKGKFDEKIEIDLSKKILESIVTSPSANIPFLFDTKLIIEINVIDALTFYLNKVDLSDYVKFKFFPVIKKITKERSVTYYSNMDDQISEEFDSIDINYEDIGVACRILDVSCTPNSNSSSFTTEISNNKLREETEKQKIESNTNIEIIKADNARKLVEIDIIAAIYGEVTTRQITIEDALSKITKYKQDDIMLKVQNIDVFIELINKLKAADFITEVVAAEYIKKYMKGMPTIINDNEFPSNKLLDEWVDEEGEDTATGNET